MKAKTTFLILFLAAVSVFAQTPARNQVSRAQSTAAEIEILLSAKTITYAQASRFVLEAANVLATENHDEAFNYAVQQNWLPKKAAGGDSARLDNISLLLMRSFNTRGGIMYSITKAPHYAYRELQYIKIIQNRSDPTMIVSGEQLLYYVNRILAEQEARTVEKKKEKQPKTEATSRREALAAEITTIIKQQKIGDTTVKATNEGVMITLSNIMFPADSAVLPPSEMVKIRELARVLRSNKDVNLLISGHTTPAGTEAGQFELSKARAKSVADYLILLDACEPENISIVGYGSSRPVADNTTPQGMAANRRVEITILDN